MNSASTPWSEYLWELQDRLGETDTGMAAKVGVSLMTYWGWKNNGTIPRKTQHLDRIVEISGDSKAKVYQLAGRGYVGMEIGSLRPEYAEMALSLQNTEDGLKLPSVRRGWSQRLKYHLRALQDEFEFWTDVVVDDTNNEE